MIPVPRSLDFTQLGYVAGSPYEPRPVSQSDVESGAGTAVAGGLDGTGVGVGGVGAVYWT